MSMFKKIIGDIAKATERTLDSYETQQKVEYTDELHTHLLKIGVNAIALEARTPEFEESRWGLIKVEDQNIDWIEIDLRSSAVSSSLDGDVAYYYQYHVRVNVEGLKEMLKVEGKPKRKGFFSKEVVDYQWKGGDLAQRLNADADLKNMLITARLGQIFVQSSTKFHGTACIIPEYPAWTNRADIKPFPTRETFELYDRIAHHIRTISNS